MRVLFVLIGPKVIASSRVRVLQFLPRLRAEFGVEPTIRFVGSTLQSQLPTLVAFFVGVLIKRWRALITYFTLWFSSQFDAVVLHRVLLSPWILRRLNQLRKPIVFDFDDALSHEGFYSRRISEHRLQAVLKAANLVITSSTYNADSVREQCRQVEVIPSSVDTSRYRTRSSYQHPAPVIIGWIGSPSTTPYLVGVSSVLSNLSRVHSIKVLTIGADRNFRFEGIDHVNKSWSEKSEADDLLECDIGIMPLPDNEWTRGKGGYKLLQYMAAGLPVVASPVTINREIVQDSVNGFLATTEQEWLMKLSLLIEDADLRESMGQKGRALVEQRYSSDKAYSQLTGALTTAWKAI